MEDVISQKDLEYKKTLLQSGIFKKVKDHQYKVKECPFCGDSKYHMYVMIKTTDDTPVLYNCFKCNSSGIVNKKFLEYYDIEDIKIPRGTISRRKIDSPEVSETNQSIWVNENDNISSVCEYINRKVGHYPTLPELQYFQFVGNPEDYAKIYLDESPSVRKRTLFDNRHWFRLTNGNITGRSDDDNNFRLWHKYNSSITKGRGIYNIRIPFDLYKPINVCISEGIMDVIGLYYNYFRNNNIYLAVLGKDYEYGLQHLINMGIFGDNVNIKIFKDSDVNLKDIRINSNVEKLFGKIDIYQNLIDKDYGVLPDKLDIQKIIKRR